MSTLRKVSSARMFHQAHESQNTISYPLKRKVSFCTSIYAVWCNEFYAFPGSGSFSCFFNVAFFQVQHNTPEEMHEYGCLLVSSSYFERKTTPNFQRDTGAKNVGDRDVGFWVSPSEKGGWESIRSLLPLSVVPKSLQHDFIAMEVVMKNGKKHAIFRSLATVINESDIILDFSVCHVSSIHGHNPNLESSNNVVEEIFQNQFYNASSGWGNNWSGFRGDYPGNWSTQNFSYSSRVSVLADLFSLL